jgi:hypothetical protein
VVLNNSVTDSRGTRPPQKPPLITPLLRAPVSTESHGQQRQALESKARNLSISLEISRFPSVVLQPGDELEYRVCAHHQSDTDAQNKELTTGDDPDYDTLSGDGMHDMLCK